MPDDFTIFTSFDGTALGEATEYFAFVEADTALPLSSRVNERDRLSRVPARESLSPDSRRIPFVVTKTAAAAGLTPAAWYAAVQRIFSVYSGRRVLRALHQGVEHELRCDVVHLAPRNPFTAVDGILHATDPIWRAVTPSSTSVSPAVVGGNHPAQPVVTIATVSDPDIVRVRCTVTDNTGRGLVAYPIRIGGGTTEGGALATFFTPSPSNMLVIVNGLPVPFFVQGNGTADTHVDTSVSVPPFGTVDIDIYYGPGVVNTVTAQTWDTRGFDLAHASHGNDQWVWRTTAGTLEGVPVRSMFDAGRAPNVTGSWVLGQFGQHGSGVRFGWEQVGSSITFNNSTSAASDADGLQVVTQVEAAATNALLGLTLADPNYGQATRGILRPGDVTFTTTVDLTLATPHDIDGAVVVRFFIAWPFSEPAPGFLATLNVASGPPRLTLDATKIPTVTIGAPVDVNRLDGTITNTLTGDVITISDLYIDDADDLQIDTLNQVFGPAGAVMVTGTPTGGVHFTNAVGWFVLKEDASNPWTTDLSDVTITVAHANAIQA